MKLDDYRKERGLSITDLAAAIKVSVPCAWRYVNAKRCPTPEVMRRIAKWSHSRVTADDFYGIRRQAD